MAESQTLSYDDLHDPDRHACVADYWEACDRAEQQPIDAVRRAIQAAVGQLAV